MKTVKITEEGKDALAALHDAAVRLNAVIRRCAELGIEVNPSFVDASTVGRLVEEPRLVIHPKAPISSE